MMVTCTHGYCTEPSGKCARDGCEKASKESARSRYGAETVVPPGEGEVVGAALRAALTFIANDDGWYGQQRFAEDSDADFLLRVIRTARDAARQALKANPIAHAGGGEKT